MLWILVDIAVALLAVVALAVVTLDLWRQVKVLGRGLGSAADRLGQVADALGAIGAAESPGSGLPVAPATAGLPGVGSTRRPRRKS